MPVTKQQISDLMWQHESIRNHIKYLTTSMRNLDTHSSQFGNQMTFYNSIYRWSLYDLREAMRRHIKLDKRIFKMFHNNISTENSTKEHNTIKQQMDDAICLAENAVYNELSQQELDKYASGIREAFDRICEMITEHLVKEANFSKQIQKS